MFRTTPQWHRESNNRRAVDVVPGNASSGLVESTVTTSGFDLGGVDAITAGTLYKNISFFVQPFIGNSSISLLQAWARLDNLAGSHWLNLKLGKFELDEPISQERSLTLNNSGGLYYNYFFTPPGDNNAFGGIGFPQLGVELLGHSSNDYTRYSVAVVSSSNGATGLPTNQTYDAYTFFMHGRDNVFLGNAVPANQPALLPIGAAGPSWNGGFVEGHYNPNPKLIFIGRYELTRISKEANPAIPRNLGNLDTWTVGYRWYPIMSTRAGFAWLQEYSRVTNAGAAPLSGKDDVSNSLLMGFDFDF
jgi:hypothetical protein